MTNYENMSREEFESVLNKCESVTDVTSILRELSTYRVSTDQLRRSTSMQQLREAKSRAQQQLNHLRLLNYMCSERMITLVRQGKF